MRQTPAQRKRNSNVRPNLLIPGLLALSAATVAAAGASRIHLALNLQPGQTIRYEASYQSDKLTKTTSRFVEPAESDHARMAVRAMIEVQVLDVQKQKGGTTVRARALFHPLDAEAKNADASNGAAKSGDASVDAKSAASPSSSAQTPAPAAPPPANFVYFAMAANGRIDQVHGLAALPPEQQQAWQEWAVRFGALALVPPAGMKPGDKWKSEDAEKAASPIAGLVWIRESSYVDDQPCKPMQLTLGGDILEPDAAPDTCAVILTTATLRQKSSPHDTTPADFKLHRLHTSGSATGTNRIISYISLKTGLLVRATEEASQNMAVSIAKSDGSNHVHYDVNATSHSEVVQILAPSSAAKSPSP